MSLRSHQFRKPSVYVAEAEHERLFNLAMANDSRGAALLEDELVRAIILKDGEYPRDFVRLHSLVEFTDLMTGRARRVQIVPPNEADIDQDRMSVISPVGAALLGLKVGDSIGMSTDDGRAHVLQVGSVENAAAAIASA
ncbi:MAG: GreA/GreB family elongation factor [Phenylobacterium sp.]|nr:GreA/GreB family elongation factor [Phenylobacterium sp.]